MSNFILYQAVVIEEEEEEENDQESSFIDDFLYEDQTASNYRVVENSIFNSEESGYRPPTNVTLSYEEAMALSDSDSEDEDNICNFVFGNNFLSETVEEFDENILTEKRIKKFERSLKQKCKKSKDSFFNAILWGAYFKIKSEKIDHLFNFGQEKLEKVLGVEFVNKFIEIKEDIHLDINLMTFERKMHLVNDLLFEKNIFLRLY